MKKVSRFRISLFGLLILTAGIAVVIASWSRSAKRQKMLVDGIFAGGGNVAYDWQIDHAAHDFKTNATAPYPPWLVDLLGQHYFHSVFFAQIDLSKSEAKELSFLRYGDSLDELSLIRGDPSGQLDSAFLPKLKRIDVSFDGTLDVSFLTKFPSLETASIDADRIVGLSALAKLGRLNLLNLRTNHLDSPLEFGKLVQLRGISIETFSGEPPLTDLQLQEVRTLLPSCKL